MTSSSYIQPPMANVKSATREHTAVSRIRLSRTPCDFMRLM